MIPSVDERLASVIRALTDVVMPSVPKDSELALEQLQISVGHLQILRSQLDATPTYEQGELSDAIALGTGLVTLSKGGPQTMSASSSLREVIDQSRQATDVRALRADIHAAVTTLIRAVASDGSSDARDGVWNAVLKHEQNRVSKDRRWFAPFGFDCVDDLGDVPPG